MRRRAPAPSRLRAAAAFSFGAAPALPSFQVLPLLSCFAPQLRLLPTSQPISPCTSTM